MTNSSPVFRVGTRSSKLALIQTADAIRRLGERLPGVGFQTIPMQSPGDRDAVLDLRSSPPDFFTRDLDAALLQNEIDLAVHSAKDLPDPLPAGVDACWLPWREDPRDVLVLPAGRRMTGLPAAPRIGVSSARREAWCRSRFPAGTCLSIRGDIERRLAQLDGGAYDVLVMAAAALLRLGLESRIAEWIPPEALPVPDGQGVLAITFRAGDTRLMSLRDFCVKPVVFAGAGAGRAGTCTVETVEALQRADVCLHDALLDHAVLQHLPPHACIIPVGKRCGAEGAGQAAIDDLLVQHARRGVRVVRLKGGDPGIFGRLAEEVEALERWGLPYRVLPGVSSLQLATTGTGMLLTRRGESRGFSVLTPRAEGGARVSVGAAARAALPQVYFMAITSARQVLGELLAEGAAPDMPAAFVFQAGSPNERIVRGTIGMFAGSPPAADEAEAGLLIVGSPAAHLFTSNAGALAGRRVLLTCSEALQAEACAATYDRGGVPVPFPVIRLAPVAAGLEPFESGAAFDWLVLTSPSAVHAMVQLMKQAALDLRRLPAIMVCGDGTARALQTYGLQAAVKPAADFGAEALLDVARTMLRPGARVLRLRSDMAGETLAQGLRDCGAEVTDAVIVRNEPVEAAAVPAFDAVVFASRSAVQSLLGRTNPPDLNGRLAVAIGRPTAEALTQRVVAPVLIAREATVEAAIETLAGACVVARLAQPAG